MSPSNNKKRPAVIEQDTKPRIKKKTSSSTTELDDGTKIVETETVETHPDGTIVTKTKKESTFEQTTVESGDEQSFEKKTTKTVVETTTTVQRVIDSAGGAASSTASGRNATNESGAIMKQETDDENKVRGSSKEGNAPVTTRNDTRGQSVNGNDENNDERKPAAKVKTEDDTGEDDGQNSSDDGSSSSESDDDTAIRSHGVGAVLPKRYTDELVVRIKELASMWAEEEQMKGNRVFYWNIMSNFNVQTIAYRVPTSMDKLSRCGLPENVLEQYGERIVKNVKCFIDERGLLKRIGRH